MQLVLVPFNDNTLGIMLMHMILYAQILFFFYFNYLLAFQTLNEDIRVVDHAIHLRAEQNNNDEN